MLIEVNLIEAAVAILRVIILVLAFVAAGMTIVSKTIPCAADSAVRWPGEIPPQNRLAGKVRNIDEAVSVLPKFIDGWPNATSYQKALGVQRFARARFYHGYSSYTFCENWIANLAGLVWNDLSSIISPDDVLSRPFAGCSQQGLVVQELLKRLGIEFATFGVGAPVPHFASAAKIDGVWYLVDSWGPLVRGRNRLVLVQDLLSGKRLMHDFPGKKGEEFVRATSGGLAEIKNVNKFAAPNGLLFQKAALHFSCFGWIWLFLTWVVFEISRRRMVRHA